MTAAPAAGKLLLFVTSPHECSYLPEESATTAFVDPAYPRGPRTYSLLSQHGFRRSGEHIYRPACSTCQACVPLRIPVQEFRPGRRHRRVGRMNRDLQIVECDDRFSEEHFDLYCRYLAQRHPGAGMDDPTPDQYLAFLTSSWSETTFCEFREQGRLVAVAVTDYLPDGLSAVYTFFDDVDARRSLGSYSILWQIDNAGRNRLRWLYLGYWIRSCRKMSYKAQYLPQERFIDGTWSRIDRA